MKILFSNHTSLVGGAELFLLDVLAARGQRFEAAVLCPEGRLAELVRGLDIEVMLSRGTAGSLKLGRGTPSAVHALVRDGWSARRAARACGADLIHANTVRAALGVSAVQALPRSLPLVAHVHDTLPDGTAAAMVHRVLMHGCSRLFANSAYTAARIRADAPGEVVVIANAVDLARFDPTALSKADARIATGVPTGGPLLGMVAQITPWKGQLEAIRALAFVRRTQPDARLIIAGATKFVDAQTRMDNRRYLETCRTEVARLGLSESVAFLGERNDVPALVRACDVVLMPSWEEPFGRIGIEAMASGTPVVATSVGGPSEYIEHGVSGVLVVPRDPERLGIAVAELLDDPPARERMGAAARAAVRRYAPDTIVEALAEQYESVLA